MSPYACDDDRVSQSSPQATPVVLILGDEELLVARAIADTAARARAADPQAEVREFDAGDLFPGELAELLSPSLFGGNRVAVLRGGEDARKELVAVVLEYVQRPDPEVTLVVTHAGGAKGKAFADSLAKAGAVVVPAARITKHRERVDFVTAEFRRLGGKCGSDAAEALIEAVGHDLRELAAACAQLTADTGGRVDIETVARYYRGKAEVSGFTVADAAVAGDTAAALEALRWALHTGVDPVPIADALADGVRTVARVASAGRGNPFQLAAGLGLPAWKVEKAQRQARGWTPDGLVTAMRAAAECNEAVKGGSEDRAYALERTIMLFARARQGGAR
jgi:DNA polymerase III subunit delta